MQLVQANLQKDAAKAASLPELVSLKGDHAFRRLRRGRSGGAKFLSIRWLPTRQKQLAVGIVVSKKVGKAVVRNRVRRRLLEATRALMRAEVFHDKARFQGLPSLDLIILTRPEAADADFWQLKAALKSALKRGGVLL